ncbi:MAG TPA: biotin--[acetyl-CoA-carboxylase] ligase [Gemmatimonadales bacterium]|nr:biotin--[acetyl-CoA-carboxylase] ligase [Gemmatimonadales bacterium]
MIDLHDPPALLRYDGFTASELAELCQAPRVVLYDTIGSVLDVAHQLAEQGTPAGTIVLAEEQTAGRGRQGRVWHSPAGAGIWMAVVLRPPEPFVPGAFALRAGNFVLLAVTGARAIEARLKWPNDIVVKRRKLAGVLCEARWKGSQLQWVSVGVGINVRGPLPEPLRELATTMEEQGADTNRPAIVMAISRLFRTLGRRAGPLGEAERARLAQEVERALPTGFAEIEPDGTLVVRGNRGPGAAVLDRRVMPL